MRVFFLFYFIFLIFFFHKGKNRIAHIIILTIYLYKNVCAAAAAVVVCAYTQYDFYIIYVLRYIYNDILVPCSGFHAEPRCHLLPSVRSKYVFFRPLHFYSIFTPFCATDLNANDAYARARVVVTWERFGKST